MNAVQNGSNRRGRRHFTPEQKAAIVKRHLVDKAPLSDLCDQYQIVAAQFYLWQKQLFEHGAAAFERKTKSAGPTLHERQIETLRAKLVVKNEVIAELLQENVSLKKLDGAL
jgi:transposase-like protein